MTRSRTPSRRPSRDASGFTLVELLVVLVVMALVAAIAVPVLLTARRAAYETSAKSDIKAIAKEIGAVSVRAPGPMQVSSASGRWVLSRDGVELASGALSPYNQVSPRSVVAADGQYCLSVRNDRVGARFWSADDLSLHEGDCP